MRGADSIKLPASPSKAQQDYPGTRKREPRDNEAASIAAPVCAKFNNRANRTYRTIRAARNIKAT